MLGAYEIRLLLSVSNQASAPLRRLGADISKLQRQRDMSIREAGLRNRLQQQELRQAQLNMQTGSRGLAIQKSRMRTINQMLTVLDRQSALEDKGIGIAKTRANLDLQKLRLGNQALAIEEAQVAAIGKQQVALEKTRATMASMAVPITRGAGGQFLPMAERDPGGLARQRALLQQHRAITAQIAAERRARKAPSGEAGDIVRRRAAEARMAVTIASGSIKQMDATLEQLRTTEQRQIADLQRLSSQTNKYGRQAQVVQAQIKNLAYGYESLSASERALLATGAGLGRSLQELQAELHRLAAAEAEAAAASKAMGREMEVTQMQIDGLSAATTRGRFDKLETGARAVTHMGRAAQNAGLLATAGFGMAANSAATLNKSSTLAATQFGNNSQQMVHYANRVQHAVTDLMQSSTSDSEAISAAFYQVFSGIDQQLAPTEKNFNRVKDFIGTMADAAMAGNVDIDTATQSTIRMMNNFNLNLEDGSRLANQQSVAVRYAMASWEEYSQSLSQIIPAGQSAGQSIDDINAALAQTSRELTVPFARAGLARLFEFFQRPEFILGMKRMGVEITDNKNRLLPLDQIIQRIAKTDIGKQLAEGGKGAQQAFREITKAGGAPAGQAGTIQAGRALTVLVQNWREYAKLRKTIGMNDQQLAAAVKASLQSQGIQWDIFMNRVHAVVLEIGSAAIPAFTAFGQILKRVLDYMEAHPEFTKAVGYIGAFGSIILLVVGSLAVLVGSLGVLVVQFQKFSKFTLANEATMSRLVFRLSIYGAAIVLLIKYHKQFADAVGGTENAIKLLLAVMTGLSAGRLIKSIANIGLTAEGSEKKVGKLRGSLLRLGMLAPIIVTIIQVTREMKGKSLGKAVEEDQRKAGEQAGYEFEKGWTGWLAKKSADIEAWSQEHIGGKSAKAARAGMLKELTKPVKIPLPFTDASISLPKWTPGLRKITEAETSLKNFYSGVEKGADSARGAAMKARQEFEKTGKVPGAKQALFSDKEFLAALQRLQQLKTAAENAPNLAAAMTAWQKYNAAVKVVENRMTAGQKAVKDQIEGNLKDVTAISDAEFTKQYKHVQQLFQVATASNAIADWKKYYTATEQLSKAASQTQMAWAEKVFGQIEKQAALTDAQAASMTAQLAKMEARFNITPTLRGSKAIEDMKKQLEALTPAQQAFYDKINENTKLFTDQEAVRAYEAVVKLKEVFDKAPTLANWQAWFAANESFTKRFTDSQQQAASDIADAHKAATDKMKEDYESVLDKVRSTFDEIRSQNVTAFGQLGAGPVSKALTDRVSKIRDNASVQAAAIRDSADRRAKSLTDSAERIQRAFDDAVDNISATQGNLIDWGLAPNPEANRKTVERSVRDLNDQADRIKENADRAADKIEKDAAARADKLGKRLEEHRLTGKELIRDLQAQVLAFKNWNNDLNAIAKRGAPSALVEQLRALGPEFDPMLKAIRGMSPAMFKKYVAIFNQGQKEIDKASLQATAARLKKEYPLYLQQGKNISTWLAQGVQENPALRNAFVKIMQQVFKGVPIPQQQVKKAVPKTQQQQQQQRQPARRVQSAKPTHAVTNNNTYNYNAGKGMDYSTWLRKSHFKERNQRRC